MSRFCRNVAFVLLCCSLTLLQTGCGGSAGVGDGLICGRVTERRPDGGLVPLQGVTVVAKREGGTPEDIKKAETDVNGDYCISGVATGEWRLGFEKEGFWTLTTEEGITADRTAIGEILRVNVEPGNTSEAPEVNLRQKFEAGDGTVILTVRDEITGVPVSHATVQLGNEAVSNGNAQGEYTLTVPARVYDFNYIREQLVLTVFGSIHADGYEERRVWLRVYPGRTMRISEGIQPLRARISAHIRVDKWNGLYEKNWIDVKTDPAMPLWFSSGFFSIDRDGYLDLRVPASNNARQRRLTLYLSAPTLERKVISNIVVPSVAGVRDIGDVVMQPRTIDVFGTITDSSGNAPNQMNPSGTPDTISVVETGQLANIVNGQYLIPDVPITHWTTAPFSLRLEARVYNPTRQAIETNGFTSIRPIPGDSSQPTFAVPHITTR